MNTVLFTIAAYLIGSISFAVVVSKAFGLSDPRTYGSKNPGATNVLRSGNKKAAVLTLIGDGFKGWLAVWLAMKFGPQYGIDDTGIALVTIAVFLGHLWPVFFRFVGGNGAGNPACAECLARPGDVGDLAGDCLCFPLFLVGCADRQRVCAVLLRPVVWQRRWHPAGRVGDERLADLSSSQKHQQSACRQRKQDRFKEEITTSPTFFGKTLKSPV